MLNCLLTTRTMIQFFKYVRNYLQNNLDRSGNLGSGRTRSFLLPIDLNKKFKNHGSVIRFPFGNCKKECKNAESLSIVSPFCSFFSSTRLKRCFFFDAAISHRESAVACLSQLGEIDLFHKNSCLEKKGDKASQNGSLVRIVSIILFLDVVRLHNPDFPFSKLFHFNTPTEALKKASKKTLIKKKFLTPIRKPSLEAATRNY